MRLELISLAVSGIALFLAGFLFLESRAAFTDTISQYSASPDQRDTTTELNAGSNTHLSRHHVSTLERRIESLEKQLADSTIRNRPDDMRAIAQQNMEETYAGFDSRDQMMSARANPDIARKQRDDLSEAILDGNLDDHDRIEALKKLSVMGLVMQDPGMLEPQHISEILDIAESTNDENTRVKAWDALSEIMHPESRGDLLTEPMLTLLSEDPNPYLRRKALQGLQMEMFTSAHDENKLATISSVLDDVANTDADKGVRRQAAQSLQQLEQFRALLSESAVDGIQFEQGTALTIPFMSSAELPLEGLQQ